MSVANLGLGLTSVFVLPLKWSMVADEWIWGWNSLMGVLRELGGVPQILFEAGAAVFVVTCGLVVKWVTTVLVLPVVRFDVTIVLGDLASNKVSLVLREAPGGL